jgi:hypothetical protein
MGEFGGRSARYCGLPALASFPPSPYTSRKYVVMLGHAVILDKYGNNFKLLKFSIFEVFSCYP